MTVFFNFSNILKNYSYYKVLLEKIIAGTYKICLKSGNAEPSFVSIPCNIVKHCVLSTDITNRVQQNDTLENYLQFTMQFCKDTKINKIL